MLKQIAFKVDPKSYVMKHYKDGDFHKDYDRAESTKSITRFLMDPAGWKIQKILFCLIPLTNSI